MMPSWKKGVNVDRKSGSGSELQSTEGQYSARKRRPCEVSRPDGLGQKTAI